MRKIHVVVAGALVGLLAGPVSAAEPGATTEMVSRRTDGAQFAAPTSDPSISGDGRVVAFYAEGDGHVYAYDRQTDELEQVSVAPAGEDPLVSGSEPDVSANGRYVAFEGVVEPDADPAIFVRNLANDTTRRVVDEGADPAISSNGRFVAFASRLPLLPPDSGSTHDIYRYDHGGDSFARVTLRAQGTALTLGTHEVWEPRLSTDGRFVAFMASKSSADKFEVLLRDMEQEVSTRVSVSSEGAPADSSAWLDDLSATGRFVVFTTWASNLAPRDRNERADVYVRNLGRGITRRVSVDSKERVLWEGGYDGSISADGQLVAFDSREPIDTEENLFGLAYDVLVRDRAAGTTRRVSVEMGRYYPTQHSMFPSLSNDGRFVAYTSDSSVHVPDDVNDVRDVFVRGPLG